MAAKRLLINGFGSLNLGRQGAVGLRWANEFGGPSITSALKVGSIGQLPLFV
jgi:hypothetical protein